MAHTSSLASRSSRYGLALGSVLVAVVIDWLLRQYTAGTSPFLPLLAAVVVTAWFGGFAAAAAATALSTILTPVFLTPSIESAGWRSSHAPALLFFVVEAMIMGYATAYLVAARADAVRSAQQSQQHAYGIQGALSRLVRELGAATELERRRLATELHDYQAQLLTVARMKLARAGKQLPPAKAGVSWPLIQEADEMILHSLTYARTLMAELHPPILHEKGLLPALRWLAEQMSTHGLRVNIRVDDADVPMASDHCALVYQSVRELLMNIIKHSGVHEATLIGRLKGESLEVKIADGGCGFDPQTIGQATDGRHFGLSSVRDRIAALGGDFEIDSAPGRGATMRLTLPVTHDAHHV